MALYGEIKIRFLCRNKYVFGAGVTLRFLLVQWVPITLGMTDNTTPTILNAMVAIGIVIGASLVTKFVTLKNGPSLYARRGFNWWLRCCLLLITNHHYSSPILS